MLRKFWLASALGAAVAAAAPVTEEASETPPELEIKPITARCEEVVAPYRLRVHLLGDCDLIGIVKMAPQDPYYGKALKFVKEHVLGQEVRVEICPNVQQTPEGQNRAIIYYRLGEKWYNLNIELLRAGLARVTDVPRCHVALKAWFAYEAEARKARAGMWEDFKEPPAMTSDEPDISDFR